MGLMVFETVSLFHQDLSVLAIPRPGPVLVGPAKTEWHIAVAVGQHLGYGCFQQLFPVEPIMVITEAINSI